ncbi:hypothetical protein HDE68_004184 [Pedobacter cryoconitis]|uniref:Uncharacterized protein n=1 Tax=Pedobacter cryoconitis TaxID=188932 RepID=A0A7W8ZQS4_9SPHI|nr:hypothetical protein [Pedobacter cryoconitis]MBB5638255.1 hypothetical protein [Pedobacter cryoconitis]
MEEQQIDFGFWFYYNFEERTLGNVEEFFRHLEFKISAYERQVSMTASLYETEQKTAKKKNDDDYNAAMEAAEIRYHELYNEIIGSDHERSQYASHYSGIDQIEGQHQESDEPLSEFFQDMKDSYYKSSVMMLYSLLESELKTLCGLLQNEKSIQLGLEDFGSRDYMAVSIKYLKLVVLLEMIEIDPFENILGDLQNLRNRLVHDQGLVSESKLAGIKKIVESSGRAIELVPQREFWAIKIYKPDFLLSNYTNMRLFFQELFWLIDKQNNYNLLSQQLTHMFGFVNPNVSLSNLTVSNSPQGVKINSRKKYIQTELNFPETPGSKALNVSIIFGQGPGNKIKFTFKDGLHLREDLKRLKKNLETSPEVILNNVLKGFYMNEGRRLEIKFSKE